jgi:hypothetical protein
MPCTSAEELIERMEETSALLRASCLAFYEKKAA